MLIRKDIEQKIKEIKPILEKDYYVEQIGIFGSYARNEAAEESDIDIIVRFKKPIGWEFIDLKEYLEKMLGKPVDLVTEKALKPQLRDRILSEVIYQ